MRVLYALRSRLAISYLLVVMTSVILAVAVWRYYSQKVDRLERQVELQAF
ncbi:MAG: hypothetical protein R2800_11000 [Flavipsychrobacter sp.]